jgi:hypothetical protein
MCGKAEKQIRADLDATGLPYALERGSRHLKIKLMGHLVGIIPMKGRDNVGDRRTYLNVRAQIRRKAKELA